MGRDVKPMERMKPGFYLNFMAFMLECKPTYRTLMMMMMMMTVIVATTD